MAASCLPVYLDVQRQGEEMKDLREIADFKRFIQERYTEAKGEIDYFCQADTADAGLAAIDLLEKENQRLRAAVKEATTQAYCLAQENTALRDENNQAYTELLNENQRLRDALEKIAGDYTTKENGIPYHIDAVEIAKEALEETK